MCLDSFNVVSPVWYPCNQDPIISFKMYRYLLLVALLCSVVLMWEKIIMPCIGTRNDCSQINIVYMQRILTRRSNPMVRKKNLWTCTQLLNKRTSDPNESTNLNLVQYTEDNVFGWHEVICVQYWKARLSGLTYNRTFLLACFVNFHVELLSSRNGYVHATSSSGR